MARGSTAIMPIKSARATVFLALCCFLAGAADAYRYSVMVETSQLWAAPVGATNISVTLWGAGGGSSTSRYCGASGGSGAAVIDRSSGSDAWDVPASDVQWTIVVGEGGAGLPSGIGYEYSGGTAGDGGASVVVATAPNGTELFRAAAYGGGGGKSTGIGEERACQGGGGGGEASSAVGPVPGGGQPSGGADNNSVGPPAQGAMAGDVKAGGAGAGYGFEMGDVFAPFTRGADWVSPGRSWPGGHGDATTACSAWGGAAGYNGHGGWRQASTPQYPPANSGSGAGSATVCVFDLRPNKYYEDMAGAAGGVIMAYDHPVGPTPSASPSRSASPSPSRTPSVSPTPSAQPWSQLVTLVSPISGRQLTPQDDGSVKSLWVGASYKEKWTVARLPNGKYTFRAFNGRYLGANPGGWTRADATAVGSWEQWDVLINDGNRWTLKSIHGTYMGTTAAGVVYLNSNADLYWTKTVV
ncbi:Fascin-like incomplete domain containing protein [Pandoravirus salinus]|uniref:Fascin-like incomplete domain containing protein n=1 Tax=Pandoravirus salinus TaxID=1349410 RepID=A0A291ATV4_9VIRU|nr:Fascin-like incomplete domain [Pandoravirus salinus]ATE82255.1 Fascin-like incomplete domain containing protein [Pandoravirus salinus]